MVNNASFITSKAQLIESLAVGCKPDKSSWRIGSEHEKFVFHNADNSPLSYDGEGGRPGIKHVFDAFEQYGWEPVVENGYVIAALRDGASLSLEPGGQFELSGAPLGNLHQVCNEVSAHIHESREIGDKLGIGFLGLGFHPTLENSEIPFMPKKRYHIMRDYMTSIGEMGLDMMLRSCTVQVNLDFASEADMATKFRLSMALQPIVTAIFSNSPFRANKLTGFQSFRSEAWTRSDADRTGILPFVFEDDMSFEHYVDYALGVPMYFVRRGDEFLNATGKNFRDFLAGKLSILPGELPIMSDWEDHLTTLYPEVRLKTFLEMRGADCSPLDGLCSMPALWVGLLYDDQAQAAAFDLIKDWSAQEVTTMRHAMPKEGFDCLFRGKRLQEWAKDVVEIADMGLKNRNILNHAGDNEQGYLANVKNIVSSGNTRANALIEKYNGVWNGDISKVFREDRY